MTKKLNVEAITNELHGASLYFNAPKPAKTAPIAPLPHLSSEAVTPAPISIPERPYTRTSEQANTRTGERVNRRTGEHLNARTPERVIVRQSYNVYEDQHQALKRLEAKTALSGKKSTPLSAMIRQAIDEYLSRLR